MLFRKLALIALMIASPWTEAETLTSTPPRVCYQEVCLLEPVSELSLPVAAVRVRSKGSSTDEWSAKQAMEAFRVSEPVARQLLRHGFLFGEPNSLTGESLKLIQGVPAVCDDSAKPFQVHVRAGNGRPMILGYRAITTTNLSPQYRLASIAVEFPEVRSSSERTELFQQASQTLNIKLQCSSAQSSDCDVVNSKPEMTVSFWAGNMIFSVKNPYLSLDIARNHPSCRTQIRF